MKQHFTKFLFVSTILFVTITKANAQAGTTNGTYNFTNVSTTNDSHSSGFKTQQDKFAVNNNAATYNTVPAAVADFVNCMRDFSTNATNGSGVGNIIIKAEGTSTCKTFTLKNMAFYINGTANDNRSISAMTVTIKNYAGAVIATHSLSSAHVVVARTLFSLSSIGFSTPFPAAGYTGVSQIEFTYTLRVTSTNALTNGSNLLFRSITLEDISAATPVSNTTWNGTTWSNGAPTATIDAVIASNTAPASFTCKDLTINNTFALTTTGITATVNGNIVNNGNGIAGTGGLTIAANSTISGTAISFNGALTVNTGATLTTGGLLTLASNATNTARVANSAGVIDGTVAVQRYIPGKRAYRFLTAPLSSNGLSAVNVSNSWQLNTHIVGPTGTGLDAVKPMYSMLTYASGAWQNVTNTTTSPLFNSTATASNRAFALFLTGDRTISLNSTTAFNNTTLSSTGKLLQGTQSISLGNQAANSYHFIGNPYASPVDLNQVFLNAGTSNINRTFYTWDPTLSTTGGYVTISWNGSSYTITPSSGSTSQTQILQSGQAFFVQATANAATTIAFEENDKSTTTINNVFGVGNGQIDNLNINLKRIENGNLSTRDGVTASFGASYNKAVNFNEDAEKLFNNEEGITLKRGTNNLSIERRPFITNQNDTLFLALNRLQINTNYTLNINPQNFDAGMQAFLVDRLLSTETAINLQSSSQDINITSATATVADRWMIVFRGTGNLPNNKLSLVATKKDRDVQLTWNIANEQGVKDYELQRSVNGTEFTTINNQVASNKAEYNNVDTKANNGINYYRVKMTMLNDDVRYSNVVTINLKLSTVNPVTVYPNPIKGSIAQLQLNELAAGNYTIRLMDMQGKLVQTQNIQHQGGTTSRSLGLGNVAAGNYQLVVEGKGFTHTISVIKSN
jgi:hypothetical protein